MGDLMFKHSDFTGERRRAEPSTPCNQAPERIRAPAARARCQGRAGSRARVLSRVAAGGKPSGLIADADTCVVELLSTDRFLIIGCDGLWDGPRRCLGHCGTKACPAARALSQNPSLDNASSTLCAVRACALHRGNEAETRPARCTHA
jgi:hypothetical protein